MCGFGSRRKAGNVTVHCGGYLRCQSVPRSSRRDREYRRVADEVPSRRVDDRQDCAGIDGGIRQGQVERGQADIGRLNLHDGSGVPSAGGCLRGLKLCECHELVGATINLIISPCRSASSGRG